MASILTRARTAVARATLRTLLRWESRSGVDLMERGWSPLGAAFGLGPRRNVRKWLETFGRNPRLFQAVNRMSTDVGAVRSRVVFEDPPDDPSAGLPKRQDVPLAHPLRKLWERPHPHFTRGQFTWLGQTWLDIAGEAAFLIDGDITRPDALWPIPPHWLTRVPTQGEPWYEATFLHQSGGQFARVVQRIPPEWVIFLHRPDPLDPFGRGLGPAFTIDDQVTLDEWMAKFNASFFSNGCHPGVILGIEELNEKNIKLIREQFEGKQQGFMNAFRTAILDKVTSIHQVTPTHKDLQFTDGAKYNRDVIWQTYGLPPEVMGAVENSNRATAEAADYIHQSKNILPRTTYLEEAFNQFLVPLYGDPRLRLVFENPVREADEFRLNRVEKMMVAGTMTVNEARREFNLPPLPPAVGDVLYVPANNVIAVDANTGIPRALPGVVDTKAV